MNNLNSVLIEGTLVRDAEHNWVHDTPVCSFTVASNSYHRLGDVLEKEVTFIPVEVYFKAVVERCKALGCKGRAVRVVGRLKQVRWVDVDNNECSKLIVVAEHVEFRPKAENEKEVKEFLDSEVPEDIAF